ncbi:MAG: hypothetical protein EBU07_15060 [Betaproteobacteria bacterium]|nr:hypothetical protein [Betaproteobacteria bacterium]
MNVQRFQAQTLRDALAKARKTFGDGTLILANRQVGDGFEVVATAEEALGSAAASAMAAQASVPASARTLSRTTAPSVSSAALSAAGSAPMQASTSPLPRSVHEDTERLAMSTLSFQEYVRERMMSKRMAAPQREPEWPQREPAQDFGAAMLPPAPARERAPQVQAERPQTSVGQSPSPPCKSFLSLVGYPRAPPRVYQRSVCEDALAPTQLFLREVLEYTPFQTA